MSRAPRLVSSTIRTSVLAIVLSTATLAHGAPSEAQERFEEGRALLKAGRPADAIPKFVASIATEPTLAALLNLADCYERIGKLASAHARFRQAQELAKDKDPVRADEARKRAEILEPRLSTITLLPPPQSEGVRVWVDGIEVPHKEWGKPRPYDVGPHEIISQSARGARHKTITQVGADAARVTAPIEVDAAPEKRDGAQVVGPPLPPKEDSSAMRTGGLVTGGVGLAVLATGVVTGIVALGASSDLKDSCPTYPQCPSSQRGELVDLDDRAQTFGTVSTITVIAGSALVIAGAVLYLTAPSRSSSSTAARAARWSRGWQVASW